jgi:hypothetical protein
MSRRRGFAYQDRRPKRAWGGLGRGLAELFQFLNFSFASLSCLKQKHLWSFVIVQKIRSIELLPLISDRMWMKSNKKFASIVIATQIRRLQTAVDQNVILREARFLAWSACIALPTSLAAGDTVGSFNPAADCGLGRARHQDRSEN